MGVIRVILKDTERYVYLAHLTDTTALIAFGAFHFSEQNELIDDSLLPLLAGRTTSIGEGSEYYGEFVEVRLKEAGTGNSLLRTDRKKNYCWVEGLKPDTEYEYEVFVDGNPWINRQLAHYSADRVRTPLTQRYDNRFKTFPAPDRPANCAFAVVGDYGSGSEIQYLVAKALEQAVKEHDVRFILATGDNIYGGAPGGVGHGDTDRGNDSGEDDDDWFFTFFQPYRFVINRVPVFAAIGNHDSSETAGEGPDDREALYDNLFMIHRFNLPVGRGPGLFYTFRYGSEIEFICLDSSSEEGVIEREGGSARKTRVYKDFRHRPFLDEVFRASLSARPKWRVPFFHHSPFSQGPRHGDDGGVQDTFSRKFGRAAIRTCFTGHNHNFQWLEKDSINFFISGGGGKPEEDVSGSTNARLKAWGGARKGHFLIVKIDVENNSMQVIPYTENRSGADLVKLPLFTDAAGRRRFTRDIKI